MRCRQAIVPSVWVKYDCAIYDPQWFTQPCRDANGPGADRSDAIEGEGRPGINWEVRRDLIAVPDFGEPFEGVSSQADKIAQPNSQME